MSRIKLDDVRAKVKHLQGRNELHGNEPALAMDLRLVIDIPNDKLDMLDRRLISFLYWFDPRAPVSEQTDIEGDRKINLRFPNLGGPLKWREEYDHAVVRLLVKTSAEVTLKDAAVNTISFHAKEGGTVALELRVQTLINEADLAHIFTALGKEIPVAVDTCPPGEEQLPLPEPAQKPKRTHKKKTEVVAIREAMEGNGAIAETGSID